MDEVNYFAQEAAEETTAYARFEALQDAGWHPVQDAAPARPNNYNYAEDLPL